MKSFSSAYRSTVENDFAKSKQRHGFLDESRGVLHTFYFLFAEKVNYSSISLYLSACGRPTFSTI
ncbi:MAG: hypothetical protein U0M60_11085 [Clostridia bacterium]|nr:hypothetical protein [Clostridia bacterium]